MDLHLKLSNRLYEVVAGNITCFEAWGRVLFHPDFNQERELRNRVGVIWLCSLLDTISASHEDLEKIVKAASQENYDSIVHNCAQMQKFCGLASELLELYSREEQIFLVDLRNQWVHSYLSGRHKDAVSVKYVAGGAVKKEAVPPQDYHATVRAYFEQGPLDEVLASLVDRALQSKLRYWGAVGLLMKHRDNIYAAICEGKAFDVIA